MSSSGDAALLALLELAHPASPSRTAVSGRRIRAAGASRSNPGGMLDVCVLAPSFGQALSPHWRKGAARLAADHLAADGVVHLLSPAPLRGLLRRALTGRGLVTAEARLHVPSVAETRWIVPLERASRLALAHSLGRASARRWLLVRALAVPGVDRVLRASLPHVGLVLRRPGARPCSAWLAGPDGDPPPGWRATVEVSFRGAGAGAVAMGWGDGAAPVAVAKIAFGSAAGLSAEDAALRSAGPPARRAGAGVPEVRDLRPLGRSWALIESPVAGRPAAVLVRADERGALELLGELARWLARWSRATAAPDVLGSAWLDRLLLRPAAELEPELHDGAAYRGRLAALAERVDGRTVPRIALHNDLTTANVLWSRRAGLGVVDWANAGTGLPLMDFSYAAVDAAYVALPGDRTAAFAACFERPGAWRSAVGGMREQLSRTLALDADVATVAFHACFLQHAVNERRQDPGSGRPFLALVERTARVWSP